MSSPRPIGGAGGDRARVRLSANSTAVVRGEEDVSSWDWEELRRGRKRSVDGRFYGRDPIVIPRPCFEEMYRRVITTAEQKLMDALPEVVDALVAIVRSEGIDDATRLRAIQYAMNRVMGSPTDRAQVEVAVTRRPWEAAIADALVATDDDVVDAEVIDEDEVLWDDVG